DASGSLSLPVERIRRFVTPVDLAGTGRVMTTNGVNNRPSALGADAFGRVTFQGYFRPPGVPIATTYTAGNDNVPGMFNFTGANTAWNSPVWPDRTNNRFHAFAAMQTPGAAGGFNALGAAGMPFDVLNGTIQPGVSTLTVANATPPTFSWDVSSKAR